MAHHGRGRRGTRYRSPKARARYSVFLSHATRDLWIAKVMKEKIERLRGVSVWLDQMSIQGGDNVLNEVVNGIERSAETVVLVSQEALKSQWVATEIGIATGKSKRITPILNNVDAQQLAPLQGTKSFELNLFDAFLAELSKRAFRKNGVAL